MVSNQNLVNVPDDALMQLFLEVTQAYDQASAAPLDTDLSGEDVFRLEKNLGEIVSEMNRRQNVQPLDQEQRAQMTEHLHSSQFLHQAQPAQMTQNMDSSIATSQSI